MPKPMVSVDADATLRDIRRIAGDQFPFAFAKGLTILAKMGKRAVQQQTRHEFNLKTEFIPRGITIRAARKSDVKTKARADAAVLTRPLISSFMPPHERGGVKRPGAYGGASDKGRMLALPGRDLRKSAYQTKTGRVKKRWRVGTLLKNYNQLGPREAAGLRGSRKRFGPRTPFIVRSSRSGQALVVRRRSLRQRRPLEILYILVPSARIPSHWKFEPTVRLIVRANYVRVIAFTTMQALQTARR